MWRGWKGAINGLKLFMNLGKVKLASWRSLGWNCRSQNFWVQDVYHGTGGKIWLSMERNDGRSEYCKWWFNAC
jgi:hypothetical protein